MESASEESQVPCSAQLSCLKITAIISVLLLVYSTSIPSPSWAWLLLSVFTVPFTLLSPLWVVLLSLEAHFSRSVAKKTLFCFHDLRALKAILWLEGICLLPFSHPLSFEGYFWEEKGNLSFSLRLPPGTNKALKMDDGGVLLSSTITSCASGTHMGRGCVSHRNRAVAKENVEK